MNSNYFRCYKLGVVADKPTGDISYMEKVIDNIDFEAIQKCTEQYEQQFKQKLEEDGTPKAFK